MTSGTLCVAGRPLIIPKYLFVAVTNSRFGDFLLYFAKAMFCLARERWSVGDKDSDGKGVPSNHTPFFVSDCENKLSPPTDRRFSGERVLLCARLRVSETSSTAYIRSGFRRERDLFKVIQQRSLFSRGHNRNGLKRDVWNPWRRGGWSSLRGS